MSSDALELTLQEKRFIKKFLAKDSNDNCEETLSSLLASILDLNSNNVDFKDALEVIEILTEKVPYDNNDAVENLCQFMHKIFNNSPQIVFQDVKTIFTWLILALDQSNQCYHAIFSVINVLFNFCEIEDFTFEIPKSSLDPSRFLVESLSEQYKEFVRQLITKGVNLSNYVDLLLSLLLANQSSCEVILNSLQALRHTIQAQSLETKYLRQILSVAWRYMSFDSQVPFTNSLVELNPISINLPIDTSQSKKNTSMVKKNATLNSSLEDLISASKLPPVGDKQWDSSRIVQSYIRCSAICLIITVTENVEPSTLFPYWSYLIFPGSPSLRNCIRNDSSWSVRYAALHAIENLLVKAKPFLVFAENPRTVITSFTTFSETLGATLLKLHDDFIFLYSNSNASILKQTLRCLSALVYATPYKRLGSQFLIQIVQKTRPLTLHSDQSVRLEAIILLKNVVRIEDVQIENMNEEIKWIMSLIIDYTLHENQPSLVVIKCLHLLGSLSRFYMSLILVYFDEIVCILKQSLKHNSSGVQIKAGRTIEYMSESFKDLNESQSEEFENTIAMFWEALAPSLAELIQSEQSQLAIIACDCLGNMQSNVFQNLPRKSQLLFITILFSATRNQVDLVRGAAIRALTRGILDACRQDDFGLIEDITGSCFSLMQDESLYPRINAAWGLSNLTDALVLNRSESIEEDLSDQMYMKIANIAYEGNQDDKIKCNIIRTIGNLFHLATVEQLKNPEYYTILDKLVNGLIKNLLTKRDMKVKWNACYAIGKILKNEQIYSLNITWNDLVIPALIKTMTEYRNFKVRTKAALALSLPSKREYYASHWNAVWSSLLQVLDISQHIDDFKEYKHREALIEQICLTLAHLLSVAKENDFIFAIEPFILHADLIKQQLQRSLQEVLQERAAIFALAVSNLNNLMASDASVKVKNNIKQIHQVFGDTC